MGGKFSSQNITSNTAVSILFNTEEERIEKYFKYFNYFYISICPKNTRVEKFKEKLKMYPPNICNKEGKNLFHYFLENCICDCEINSLQILLEYGCDLNKRDNYGKTPVFYVKNGDILSFCIKNKADLTIRDNENHTPLYYLSKGYYKDICKTLKCHDPEYIHLLDLIDYNEYPPEQKLAKAVWFQDTSKIYEFLKENPDCVNQITNEKINNYGDTTPLFIACSNDLYDEFMILLDNGANIHTPGLIERMMWVFYENTEKMIRILIERGVDINKCYEDDYENILHRCYVNGAEKIIRLFLEKGADINKKTRKLNKVYRTENLFTSDADVLMTMTVFIAHIDVFRALFEYGADPNKKNYHGVTPFMGLLSSIFIMHRLKIINKDKIPFEYDPQPFYDIVQLFLDYGADISVTDNHNQTALDYLVNNFCISFEIKKHVIKMLKEKSGFIILNPNTNKFIYSILVEPWNEKNNRDVSYYTR